ncbi:helix-turn-helix transcriptional regulator [Pyrobaculum neutrophilum]|uniref:Transcriptional regulator, TrmB n=1 Tax=Pyrobaculum neutrophilum (strain DSM 2338 / JCM 9278 / NBRC 100436 / V24Sta) TaxID=444157 RepID=B1YAS5_PYRNV|nr:winged helix-turn-helix transcriptional regulator [Pyrobaculum neutrophilum]ACB39154.1 transcriptional regulator, TrmB [Pyrobaculum neutrophilum V24Sta]
MIWVLLLFANGTALMVFNATVTAAVFNVTLPAQPLSAPVVELDRVPVPALYDGSRVSVVTGGRGLVTIRYVPRVVDVGGLPAVNITTSDVVVVWANGSLLVAPSVKILNYTRVDKSLIIVTRGPGYIAYAIPRQVRQNNTPPAQQNGTATQQTATAAPTTQQPVTATASATPETQRQQPSTTPTSAAPSATTPSVQTTAPASTPQAVQEAGGGQLLLAAAAGVAAVAAAVAALAARRGRGDAELGDVDRRILEYVRQSGGAYEADIARDLGIPRTTVFRAVRRLAERGLVSLEKRDGRNWVAPAG